MQSSRAIPRARLRKTFHYPSDSDSDHGHPELDEQEQETLITTLTIQNLSSNITHRNLLLLLPPLSALPYLLSASFSFSSTIPPLTSLFLTSLLLLRLPPPVTGFAPLDSLAPPPKKRNHGIIPRLSTNTWSSERPIDRMLPWMNVAVGWLAGLAGFMRMIRREEWVMEGVLAALPLGILGIVVGAKMVMASVDPEAELGDLRYRYKGA